MDREGDGMTKDKEGSIGKKKEKGEMARGIGRKE